MNKLINIKTLTLCLALFVSNLNNVLGQNQLSNGHFDLFTTINKIRTTEINNFQESVFIEKKGIILNENFIKGNLKTGNNFSIDLFGKLIIATIDKISINVNKTTTIRARLNDFSMGYLIISITKERYNGTIYIPELNQKFRIYSTDNKGHGTIELLNNLIIEKKRIRSTGEINDIIDPSILPQYKSQPSSRMIGNQNFSKTIDTVDIMVVYTPEAYKWFNLNSNGIDNSIANQIEYLNLCLENSQTNTLFNLVYSGLTNYVFNPNTPTNYMDALAALIIKDDGVMDEIHLIRDQYYADIVTLVAEIQGVGGVSSGISYKTGNSEMEAFNVCSSNSWEWDNGVLAHEVGHNFGAGHNRMQLESPGPKGWPDWPENDWSAGWKWTYDGSTGPSGEPNGFTYYYADEMSYGGNYTFYPDSSLCILVPYFSNPDVIHKGYPTGDPLLANNARTIREMAPVLSNYRVNYHNNCIVKNKGLSNILDNSATIKGEVISEGSSPVTARGVVWSKNINPTTNDSIIYSGSGIGDFTCTLIDLEPRTQYYCRLFATNSNGTTYSSLQAFTTRGTGYIIDYDNNTYDTVKIGEQIWLKQNLNTTHYRDGSPIIYASDPNDWYLINLSTGKYCNFENDSTYSYYFGRLYNWHAANTNNGLCPDGWKIPDNEDWNELTTTLGGDPLTLETLSSSGFSPVLAGYRQGDPFAGNSLYTCWWSSSNEYNARGFALWAGHSNMMNINYDNSFGHSVRCIKTTITIPLVTTKQITTVNSSNASCGGNITFDGYSHITARGIVWSTNSNPTLDDNFTQDSLGIGEFNSVMTGLSPNTTYYVRAYATNEAGTTYGDKKTFSTLNTGIEDFKSISFVIYPNPVEDIFTIETESNLTIEIYNEIGSLVSIKTVNGSDQIGMTEFLPGNYTLKIIEKGKKPAFIKIIKL